MNKFTIRLTKKYTPEGFTWDDKVFPNTFMVLETDATNDHYQGLIITDQKAITVRKHVEQIAPDAVGNKAISIKDCAKDKTYLGNVDKYIIYLCKGSRDEQPKVVLNSMGVELIEDKWKSYWQVNDELRAESKKPKKERVPICVEIFEEYPVVLQHNTEDHILCHRSLLLYAKKHNKPWSVPQMTQFKWAYLIKNSEYHFDIRMQYLETCMKNEIRGYH